MPKKVKNLKVDFIFLFTIFIAAFLLFYRLSNLMSFFGDQGWFYISSQDMLLKGDIPLVGIASSHPWLHQGAFWTYILGGIFYLTHFNPLAPGYFTAGLGIIMVGLMYFVGKRMFSVNTGLIASFLYATSPLVIINARAPYHTSFIPLIVLFFIYALYKWLSGGNKYFPGSIFLVACLYNFEISTTPFILILILCLSFGIWKKKKFATQLANKKIISLSFIAWFVPMIPMLLYDVHHGFPQTVKFVLWLGYRFARLFGFHDIHGDTVFEPLAPFMPFTATKLQDFLFLPIQWIAVVLFIAIFLVLTYFVYRNFKKKEISVPLIALYLTFTIPFLSYMALQTSSEAYWPMFFPATIIGFAYSISRLFTKKMTLLAISFAFLLGIMNSYSLLKNNYLMTPENYGYPFNQRLTAAHQIITEAKGREYTIIGKGPGSKFASFIMPYTYLTWWLGHGPSAKTEKLRFIITENEKGITITKND